MGAGRSIAPPRFFEEGAALLVGVEQRLKASQREPGA